MTYLQREQRRALILQAAMQLALSEGLCVMTARRVAQAAAVSTGQVHHHFESISHLKAEVFLKLMQDLTEIEGRVVTDNYFSRLLLELGAEDIKQTQAYLSLWNEAEVLMAHDAELKKAYKQNMQLWHAAVAGLIEAGIQAQEFSLAHNTPVSDVAWRLIAFVCGLEGVYQLQLLSLDAAGFKRQTEIVLRAELKF